MTMVITMIMKDQYSNIFSFVLFKVLQKFLSIVLQPMYDILNHYKFLESAGQKRHHETWQRSLVKRMCIVHVFITFMDVYELTMR